MRLFSIESSSAAGITVRNFHHEYPTTQAALCGAGLRHIAPHQAGRDKQKPHRNTMPVPEIRVWAIVLIVVIKTHYRVLTPKVNDRRCPVAAWLEYLGQS